jgi:hypothetical protein
LGVRLSGSYAVFPSRGNEAVLGLEYQHMLNPEVEFQYKEDTYQIVYPHQFLLNLGFRKLVYEARGGAVFLTPNLRYTLNGHHFERNEAMSVKPFSVGLSLSFLLKK